MGLLILWSRPPATTRMVTLAKTRDPRSDLDRYVELDPESGLIGISSLSSIRFRVPLKKFLDGLVLWLDQIGW